MYVIMIIIMQQNNQYLVGSDGGFEMMMMICIDLLQYVNITKMGRIRLYVVIPSIIGFCWIFTLVLYSWILYRYEGHR